MPKREPRSISGTRVLPEFEHRKKADDFRGRVEKEVMRAWADANIPQSWLNRGKVPADQLVPLVRRANGQKILDPTALLAVNTTIQWLFGTNVGRSYALKLLAIEDEVLTKERERTAKSSKKNVQVAGF